MTCGCAGRCALTLVVGRAITERREDRQLVCDSESAAHLLTVSESLGLLCPSGATRPASAFRALSRRLLSAIEANTPRERRTVLRSSLCCERLPVAPVMGFFGGALLEKKVEDQFRAA